MLFNTRIKKISIFTPLLVLSIIALVSSTLGWHFGEKFPLSGGAIYYNGFKVVGFAGFIVSVVAALLSVILLTTEIANPHFFKDYVFVMYSLLLFIVLLLIPSLTLGLLSYFDLNHVWVIVKGK